MTRTPNFTELQLKTVELKRRSCGKMKLSLKIRDDQQQQHKNPLFKAKLPVSIAGLPFLSAFTAGDPSDLSFNLSTNFLTGPSLKLSYAPAAAAVSPFALSLKSGVGLFGSSRDSPLVISAHFNLFSSSGNPNPSFSLQFKPQFGHFSLHKATFSNPSSKLESGDNSKVGLDGESGTGFAPEGSTAWTNITLQSCSQKIGIPNFNQGGIGFGPERPLVWRDLTMESCNVGNGILSGVRVRANTALPVASRFVANFRWGLNVPAQSGGRKLPFLTVDKIGIERVEKVNDGKQKVNEEKSDPGDVELLKSMCDWMRSDLKDLHKENLELRQSLEKMKIGIPARNEMQKFSPPVDKTSDTKWRTSKKSGGDNDGKKELRKPVECPSDLESELQKAIKAASS